MSARTLPIRLAPLPGEALDSWVEALGRRLSTALRDLLPGVGLTQHHRASDHPNNVPRRWHVLLRSAETASFAEATGIDPATITSMTLAHYEGRALRIDHATRRVIPGSLLWGRAHASRFCPDCLASTNGRWLLEWRLDSSFVCLPHRRLLTDRCPGCDSLQRQRPQPMFDIPRPGRCTTPIAQHGNGRGNGRAADRCGRLLAGAVSTQFRADHPILNTQKMLTKAITTGIADFGIYAADPQPVSIVLSDLRAIAARVLTHDTRAQLPELLPEDLLTVYDQDRAAAEHHFAAAAAAADRAGYLARSSTAANAVALTVAIQILNQPDPQRAGAALRWLTRTHRPGAGLPSRPTLTPWGQRRPTSPRFRGAHLAAIGPRLTPADQLRYQTRSPRPHDPLATIEQALVRTRSVPAMFWPVWGLRLSPAEGTYTRIMRPALARALLLVGSPITPTTTPEHLGGAAGMEDTSRILQRLSVNPHWPHIQDALIRLADYLDLHPAPIDYQRRRCLDYSNLLTAEDWESICHRSGTLDGHGPRLRIVRCLLFERLSGMPADLAPPSYAITSPTPRANMAGYAVHITPALADELTRAAHDFLRSNGIDEPLTWQPPLTLLNDLRLPGPDPSAVDLPTLHDLIRKPDATPSQAATTLGTTIDVVRYLLEEHPAPVPPVAPPPRPAFQAARATLPPEELARLRDHERLTIEQIAARFNVGPQIITDLAKEYGIPLRDPRHHREAISREWLYKQYVTHYRSLADLAHEKGMSKRTMAAWARKYQIPIRPNAAAVPNKVKRARLIDGGATAPAILRPTLYNPAALRRLERLAATAQHPSIKAAARTLGLDHSMLAHQIRRLEHDLGGHVLIRGARNRPTILTALGRQVLEALRTFQNQPESNQAGNTRRKCHPD